MVRKNYRRAIALATISVLLLLALGSGATYWASRQAPGFYRAALTASPQSAEFADRFERAALALHNTAQHSGRWELSVSADEMNGWLATDLPAKFPQLLPAGISEPRVAIDGETFQIAVHYCRSGVDTVLSLSGQAYLTAQTNEVAIKLNQARAGLVPIPLGRVIQEINDQAMRADYNLRWTEVQGSPVALVRLPLATDDHQRRFVLDQLDIRHGQILLAGRTEVLSAPNKNDGQPATASQPDKATRQR